MDGAAPAPQTMTTVLIVYHSQGGTTETMARAVAEGVRSIEQATAILKRASDATVEDLLRCDGLAIGSPEYFGYMAGMVKDFFDRTYEAARGRREIFKKPYVAFVSAGNDGTGAATAIERICLGYPLKKVYEPVIARGVLDDIILDRLRELGAVLAGGLDAGIF